MSKNLINYATTVGNIKHFYGFTFTLGGIVSITGEDFEKMNGYLNLGLGVRRQLSSTSR
jgi:hypothetical protein